MKLVWALVLGLVLGIRHATDADHVAAIGTMLHREPSMLRAARLAVTWGLGHTFTFATLGVIIILAGVHVPPRFEHSAEVVVAAMLIGLGGWTIWRTRSAAPSVTSWRPLLVGVVHGLAGSAGVALVALTTITSRAGALVYLALFGAGTIAGMTVLTVSLSVPLRWANKRHSAATTWVVVSAALASIGLGVGMLVRSA